MVTTVGNFDASVGTDKVYTNTGINGEIISNRNEKRLTDFTLYNDLKIMNSLFQHTDSHKYMWSARGQKSISEYTECNRKTTC
jgi:hypothetical protein